jgi:hypothetical protein
LLVPLGSQASDYYPGSACRQVSGGTLAYYGGTVMNTSTTSELNLICPFVAQQSQSYVGANAHAWDRNSTRDVSCTFVGEFVTQPGGSDIVFDSETHATTGSSANSKVLGYSAAVGTYYYMTCSIPRAVGASISHLINVSMAY